MKGSKVPELPKRPTLSDVAKLAGLSVSSASMILNGVPGSGLSEDAKRRVEESAEKLGYRPNRLAKALKRSRSGTIGFVSDSVVTTRFASGLINGALKQATQSDRVLLVLETMGTPEGMKSAIETALDHQVDAIIIAAMQAKKIMIPKLPASTHVVLLNSVNDFHKTCVLPDEEGGGVTSIEILFDAGFRNDIALIGKNVDVESDPFRSATVSRRMRGISGKMKKFGIKFASEVVCENWEPSDGYSAVMNLLKTKSGIRALLCMNDRLAIGAYRAVRELGLSIPEDISIVSFDRDDFGEMLRPTLTTIGLPYEQMGEKALLLATNPGSVGEVLIPMPAFIGRSVI